MAGRSDYLPTRATQLFLHHLAPGEQDTVVELAGGAPHLTGAVAGRLPGGHLTVVTHDASLAGVLQRCFQEAHVANTSIIVAPSAGVLPAAHYDLAYAVVRPFLAHSQLRDLVSGARRVLRPGGRFLIVGSTRHGVATALRCAEEVFGSVQMLGKPGGTRIAQCVAGDRHLGAEERDQDTEGAGEVPFVVQVRGHDLAFQSPSGVFAHGALDAGTRLLLETMAIRPADRVADLGCGYGALGIAAARCAPAGWATLVDCDARAVELARHNITLNGAANAEALLSDGFAAVPGRAFDMVLSNPPLHAGHRTLRRLTAEAHAHLVPGGRLMYVVQTAYDARPIVTEIFGHVRLVAETRAFRIIMALRERAPWEPR